MIWLWLLSACRPGDWEARRDAPRSYDGYSVVRVKVASREELDALAAQHILFSDHVSSEAVFAVRQDALGQLPPHEVLAPDLARLVAQSQKGARRRALVAQGTGETGGSTGETGIPADPFWEDWQDLEEIEGRLYELEARSSHAEVTSLGTSIEGREILAIEIHRPSVRPDGPALLVIGTQHAREWVSASSSLHIAERLVNGADLDPEIGALLDEWRVIIVPITNPDGYRYTWTTDRLWRKNRRDNGDGSFGVDLNRNWGAGFGGPGSSGSGISDNYRGVSAFSEPETAALAHYLAERSKVGMVVDLHSFSQLVLYPFGFTPLPTPDDALLADAATEATTAIGALYGSVFTAGQSYTQLYPASGNSIDWAYADRGTNAWLIELRDRGQYGFLLPADQILPAAEEAWAGILALMQADRPRLSLVLSPLVAGTDATALMHRADAGATLEVYLSTVGLGSTVLADGTALEIGSATLLGDTTASARGRRRLSFPVDPALVGSTLWLQARSGSLRSMPVSAEVQ